MCSQTTSPKATWTELQHAVVPLWVFHPTKINTFQKLDPDEQGASNGERYFPQPFLSSVASCYVPCPLTLIPVDGKFKDMPWSDSVTEQFSLLFTHGGRATSIYNTHFLFELFPANERYQVVPLSSSASPVFMDFHRPFVRASLLHWHQVVHRSPCERRPMTRCAIGSSKLASWSPSLSG